MTIAMDRPGLGPMQDERVGIAPAEETERVQWSNPARWLWVAETPTGYLGMVDRNHDGFVATSFDGRDLGVFASRADAQVAVYGYWFRADDLLLAPVQGSRTLYQATP